MSKAIKFKDNTYFDSTGIVHERTPLNEVLNNIGNITNAYSTSQTDAYSCHYINEKLAKDVEIGSANGGEYMKFPNGILICTKTVSVTNKAVSAGAFAGTYGATQALGNMPYTFKTLYSINAQAVLTNTTDWFVGNVYAPSVSSMGTARLCRPNATGTLNGTIKVFAIGVWK